VGARVVLDFRLNNGLPFTEFGLYLGRASGKTFCPEVQLEPAGETNIVIP
jgi:hypothetical protein